MQPLFHEQYLYGGLVGLGALAVARTGAAFYGRWLVGIRFGRGFKDLGPFGSIGGSVRADWHPHAKGDDDRFT